MRVELYNNKWLLSSSNTILTQSTHIDLHSRKLDSIAFTSHVSDAIPTVKDLHVNGDITPVIETLEEPMPPLLDSVEFHEFIVRLKDKLFFINYTISGTMIRRWFLIQIDLESSASLHFGYAIRSL